MTKITLRLAAVAAASLLAGCSTMRLAYEHADTYLRWQASRYVELRGPAADDLDRRIDAFLDWHRRRALPQYEKLAREAARRLEKGLAPQDVVWGYDSFVAQARESLRQGGAELGPVLDRLNAQQVARLERAFAEDNRKFAREHLRGDEKERRKRRAKQTADRLEDWVGKLSTAQFARVKQYSERAPLVDELRLRDHQRLQAELVAMARGGESARRLPEAAADADRGREPAYAAAADAQRREYFAMLVELDRTLTRKQRGKAAERLRAFADDFAALAAAAPRSGR